MNIHEVPANVDTRCSPAHISVPAPKRAIKSMIDTAINDQTSSMPRQIYFLEIRRKLRGTSLGIATLRTEYHFHYLIT